MADLNFASDELATALAAAGAPGSGSASAGEDDGLWTRSSKPRSMPMTVGLSGTAPPLSRCCNHMSALH